MKTVNVDELRDLLLGRRGATTVTIIAETEPEWIASLNGEANPFRGNCTKLARVNGMVGWIYANSVNNQRMREGQPADENGAVLHFTPKSRRWGVRVTRDDGTYTPLVEHKGKWYLELKVQKTLENQYKSRGGEIHSEEVVHPWLRPKQEGKRQEVDNPVILRDYELKNIKQLAIDGELYLVGN